MCNQTDPKLLPFQIDELGEVVLTDQPYPGVYYVAAQKNEAEFTTSEYYIVMKETPILSQTVKQYGRLIDGHPELLVYALADDRSGWRLVDYEGLRYLTKHSVLVPGQESLLSTAVYSAEYHPEYFGEYPVPVVTPAGCTLRHRRLDNGICWLETDRCEQLLSVCYPIWSSELSETALSLSRKMEHDRNPLDYLFFSKRNSCIPLFELLRVRAQLEHVNRAALMNAVWGNFPEYAAAHNLGEQAGAGDCLGLLLNALNERVELRPSDENMIAISPEASADFIGW